MADMLTHKRVLKISLPIVLSNATIPILGAVDTGVVGQMGLAAPIGAVGIGAVILSALYWIFGFLRMGTAGLTAQAHGADNQPEVAALLTRVLIIGTAAGAAIIALQMPLLAAAFHISPASAQVETLARDYMQIRIFSAPAAIALFGITGWLIALERTKAVLILQLWMNGLNIALNFLFVLHFNYGVEGVATATLIAEFTGFSLGLYLCRDAFRRPAWRDWPRVFDRAKLTNMASVNSDIMVRSILLEAALIAFLFYGANLGDVTLAANQILLQFMHITSYAMDGFAFAAEALVGQAFGAANRVRLRRAAILTSQWGVATAISLALIFAVAGPAIVDLMTTSLEVRTEAKSYLIYMILGPLFGVAAFMLDGIFIGATRTRDMRNMMLISFAIYAAALAILLPSFGNHGLWLALLVLYIARAATLAARYPALEQAA